MAIMGIGKILQILGMVQVGHALYIGLSQDNAMNKEMLLLGIGIVIFVLGRFLERRTL
jgi:hypothetical protein